MLIFQYLDRLPKIPQELLADAYITDPAQIGFQDIGYTRWAVRPELRSWLANNISPQVDIAGYQVISQDVNAHFDRRCWAINYVVHTGGDHVITRFFKDRRSPLQVDQVYRLDQTEELDLLFDQCIEPGRWHIINTHVLHSVRGIETDRVAITIGLNTNNPFLAINGYQGYFNAT
jgi:hypothetical protein